MAPELISTPKNIRTTEATDIYSFAMLIYSVASGSHPFPANQDETVMIKVTRGERPAKPEAAFLADSSGGHIFQLVTEIWQHEPNLRPSIEQVQKQLANIRSKPEYLCSI
jgi:serine/threonine protein kinase